MTKLNNHSIHPDWHLSLDHAPLSVSIAIADENIDLFMLSITKNSKEESNFIEDVLCAIKSIEILDLSDSSKLKEVTSSLTSSINYIWKANSR